MNKFTLRKDFLAAIRITHDESKDIFKQVGEGLKVDNDNFARVKALLEFDNMLSDILKEFDELLNDNKYVPMCRHTEKELTNMVCPVCGGKTITFGKLRSYETLCEHVSDPNMLWHYLRPTLICNSEECKSFGKGFWTEDELSWCSFGKLDADLVGERLPYGWYPEKIYEKQNWGTFRHENYLYRKGKYIGENRRSRFEKWKYEKFGRPKDRAKYRCIDKWRKFSNQHLGSTYYVWTPFNKVQPPRSRMGEKLFNFRQQHKKIDPVVEETKETANA